MCRLMGVALPNFRHAIVPTTIRITAGTHVPNEPTLYSHFAMFTPTRFKISPSARPSSEKTMK